MFETTPRRSGAAVRAEFPILDQQSTASRSSTSTAPPLAEARARDSTRSTSTTAEINANVHRGVYQLSEAATARYERRPRTGRATSSTRRSPREIIFTRNTTEAINLVAQTWGRANSKPGDVILVTEMEHHSNLVPWQLLAERDRRRAAAHPALTDDGQLDLDDLDTLLAGRRSSWP